MGRLDDITERNQRANRTSRIRVWIAASVFALVVLSIVLAVYTDLGQPPGPDRTKAYGIQLRQRQATPSPKASQSSPSGSQTSGSGSASALDHAAP